MMDQFEENFDVIRLRHPNGKTSISVALPFGISRMVPATELKPRRWLSESQVLVGDEEEVIQALVRKLTSEILSIEARRAS